MIEQIFRSTLGTFPDSLNPIFGIILAAISLWSIFWKGLALWKAAHDRQKTWFIVLLVLNTAGILDIIYIFFASKTKIKISGFLDYLKE